MAPTEASCRAIFRVVAQTSHHEWPAYDSTQLYDRSSLAALKEDIHTVARGWFDHDAHAVETAVGNRLARLSLWIEQRNCEQ
jgi:hypothetical protein